MWCPSWMFQTVQRTLTKELINNNLKICFIFRCSLILVVRVYIDECFKYIMSFDSFTWCSFFTIAILKFKCGKVVVAFDMCFFVYIITHLFITIYELFQLCELDVSWFNSRDVYRSSYFLVNAKKKVKRKVRRFLLY